MEQPSNIEILKQFTLSQDEQIFATIVERYVDLVFSAALRQLHDWHLAEEATQNVFLDLLKAAPKLPTQTILGAWLHQVTRRRCVDMIRAEKRRRNRERIAADMQNKQTDQTCWKQIEGHLEEALESLSEKEYNAVILRFFEDKNHREVGETLGISEDAAQKRIQRAVQHLSSFLGKRGLGVGATTLPSLLLANTIQAAPPGLSPSILTTANLFGTGLATTTAASATQAISMTTLQKAVTTSVVTISLGVGIYTKHEANQLQAEVRQLQTTRAETMKDLQGALAEKTSLLEEAQNEIERLKEATADIHRLRSEATQYKLALEKLENDTQQRHETEDAAQALIDRVRTLREKFDEMPNAWIPEMELLTESDWLEAAAKPIQTDAQLRSAMSQLRDSGEKHIVQDLTKAVHLYKESNVSEFPKSIKELMPYVDTSYDESMFERWGIITQDETNRFVFGNNIFITQLDPVDEVFDKRYIIGPKGEGAVDFLWSSIHDDLEPVVKAYADAHNGIAPEDPDEYLTYAESEAQKEAIEKLKLWNEVRTGF